MVINCIKKKWLLMINGNYQILFKKKESFARKKSPLKDITKVHNYFTIFPN